MKTSNKFWIATAAVLLVGCSEAPSPVPEVDDEAWRLLPNADLVTGDVQYRKDFVNFTFEDERVLDIEALDEGMLYIKGAAKLEIDDAERDDVIWLPDSVHVVDEVVSGPLGTYVHVSRFDLLDYVWGDFEIDTGEAMTRGFLAEHGLWNAEDGYLTDPTTAHLLTEAEVAEITGIPTPGLRQQELSNSFNLGGITLTKTVTGGPFTAKISGNINFPIEVEGIVKLRAIKQDAFLYFDAEIDVNTEASNGDYPRCYDGRTGSTCIDHILVKFEPGIDVTLKAELKATVQEFLKWKIDGSKYNIKTVSGPPIPLGAFLKLKPTFVIDPIATIEAGTTITLKGEVNGAMAFPIGVEYFGDRNYARAQCGGCGTPECGCQQGANMLPNDHHPATKSVTTTGEIINAVGQIKATGGVSFALKLGIAPSFGGIVIDGIKAGMKLQAEGVYRPFEPNGACLTNEAKAIPFAGFDAKVRWDFGKKGEIFTLATAAFDVASYSLFKFETAAYCLNADPKTSVRLNVTSADLPNGRQDLSGYEVDSIWVTRPSENGRVISSTSGSTTEYPPDGTCDVAGNWFQVANIGSTFTWTFPERMLPGDVLHLSRLNDDNGGSCRPSGTAELLLLGSGPARSIGSADNSQNEFTFTLQDAHFL